MVLINIHLYINCYEYFEILLRVHNFIINKLLICHGQYGYHSNMQDYAVFISILFNVSVY